MEQKVAQDPTITGTLNAQYSSLREIGEVVDQVLAELGLPGQSVSVEPDDRGAKENLTVVRLMATVSSQTRQIIALRELLQGALEQVARL